MQAVRKQKQLVKHRNVNSYSELTSRRQTTADELQWAMNLRTTSRNSFGRKLRSPAGAPEAYSKPTEATKRKHTTSDLGGWSNPSELTHLIMHRAGRPSLSIVHYQGSLRSTGENDQRLRRLEKGWSSLPKIDRKEQPSIPKQESTKKKNLAKEDFNAAYDGYLNFPHYREEPVERNINCVRHLLREWQASLRSAASPEKPISKDKSPKRNK